MTTDTKAKKNPRGWWLAGCTAEMPANPNRPLPTLEGTVFEQLNKTMTLQIPPTGPYALGLAFSVQDEAGSIGTTAYVRLEGVDLEIRRL